MTLRERRRCATCDEWYLPEDAVIHQHPEPQSGPSRRLWMDSGLHYDEWVAETDVGKAWHAWRQGHGTAGKLHEEERKAMNVDSTSSAIFRQMDMSHRRMFLYLETLSDEDQLVALNYLKGWLGDAIREVRTRIEESAA